MGFSPHLPSACFFPSSSEKPVPEGSWSQISSQQLLMSLEAMSGGLKGVFPIPRGKLGEAGPEAGFRMSQKCSDFEKERPKVIFTHSLALWLQQRCGSYTEEHQRDADFNITRHYQEGKPHSIICCPNNSDDVEFAGAPFSVL